MGFKSTGAICRPVALAGYSSVRGAGPATGRYALLLFACILLVACGKPPSLLEQVKKQKELVVLTRNSPTTYYEGPDGPTGLEYELVMGFADYLGVELRLVVPPNFNDILPLVVRGDAHLAAAGLSVTDRRMETIRFGPVYQEITPQLVYRSGSVRPKSLADLDGQLEVVAGSSHAERLQELRREYPDLAWQESDQESETLLTLVWQQLIEYTIADSNELAISRRFYPELKPAFPISEPRSLAWAFARNNDDSLVREAEKYFAAIRERGQLNQLIERYYGHIREFDYVGTRRYQAHIQQRLPEYRALFQSAAESVGMDWRLLAAIGYQESHWNPDAVSPTGVRGIMMLTLAAAKDLDISNRLDPGESIHGGAEYLSRMLKRLPDHIPEPDRTWLALAAYNVGLGHLQDARVLTQKRGGDADKWVDVKKTLPLLSEKKWFQQTRYGYARGREPVRYVENIRSYYDILVWYTEKDETTSEPPKPLLLDSLAL
jgi:membrane-bound lytic murein transglycosylase F